MEKIEAERAINAATRRLLFQKIDAGLDRSNEILNRDAKTYRTDSTKFINVEQMPEPRAGVHTKGEFSLFDVMKNARAGLDFALVGAITVFIGVVRGEDAYGDRVEKLEMQAYEEKANEVLNSICDDLAKKPGITDVQIHHLLGEFEVGEDLVYVLVAGSHRESIFPILSEAVKRYKKEAPIFKKETVITKKGKRTGSWLAENHTPSTR